MRSTLALLLLCSACAPRTTAVMNPWLGKTDMQLLAAWGAPDRETTSGGEGRHLTWLHRNEDGAVICKRSFTVIDHRVEGGKLDLHVVIPLVYKGFHRLPP